MFALENHENKQTERKTIHIQTKQNFSDRKGKTKTCWISGSGIKHRRASAFDESVSEDSERCKLPAQHPHCSLVYRKHLVIVNESKNTFCHPLTENGLTIEIATAKHHPNV